MDRTIRKLPNLLQLLVDQQVYRPSTPFLCVAALRGYDRGLITHDEARLIRITAARQMNAMMRQMWPYRDERHDFVYHRWDLSLAQLLRIQTGEDPGFTECLDFWTRHFNTIDPL